MMKAQLKLILMLAAIGNQQSMAQTITTTNSIYLSCRVQVIDKSSSNYGQFYENFYHVSLLPPVVYLKDNTSKNITVTENNITWENVNINRITGYISIGPFVNGKCDKISAQRKF